MKPTTLFLSNENPKSDRFILTANDTSMKVIIVEKLNVESISILLSDGQNRTKRLDTPINAIPEFICTIPIDKSGLEILATSKENKPFNISLQLEYNVPLN